ncbi:PLP-dependent aminotransferase family protein [Aldersonia kunmingensis]|uniref:MocR-like transcription factor YczR n=1 Tax=Aldersonia kunmingensis TaxID=408066 RepID=UPI0008357EE5|nr:PLP-dependent aminotransferase family protein [Aldersonia kunmingensis]
MAARVLGVTTLVRDLGLWRPDGGRGARPTYVALAEGIRMLIHDGRIPLGAALPSERDLASALELSRTTVTSCYAMLREEGYLLSRQGARGVVALPSSTTPVGVGLPAPKVAPDLPLVDLTYAALPAPEEVHGAYSAALEQLPSYLPTHGMDPLGIPLLRETIAARYTERGLPTDPTQILVTLGAQHALRLLFTMLTAPGERVLIEHPTYPNAIQAIRDVGARPVPLPLRPEREGWDLDGIRSAARQTAARLAYLVPDFQNPTGLCLGVEGRAELASIARDTRMTMVIDESMVDLGLDMTPPPPVASFARGPEVITVGSMSKSFWGGLRVGWIRANRTVIDRLLGSRASMDLGTPVMDQLAAADLLADPDGPLERRRELIRGRRSALLDALSEQLPDWRVAPGPGGLSLWVKLPGPMSSALAATAPNFGVTLAAGPRFGIEGAFERFIRLPYAQSEADLRLAISGIAAAYQVVAPRTPAAATAPPLVV